jgi:hypothetical protein
VRPDLDVRPDFVLPDLPVVEEVDVSVLDLLSDDAVAFESALPPSFDVFGSDVFGSDVLDSDVLAAAVDSCELGSFELDSEDAPFLRASDG